MNQALSFRAVTLMIVLGYVVIVGTLVLGTGHELGRAVDAYVPQVSWMMPETTDVRLAALRAAGRPETAGLYALVAALSWGLICAMLAGGFAWGVLNKGATTLGVDKALNYLTALAGLYALATATEMALHALHLNAPQPGFHALPAVWFATMIPSAAILARVGALIAHDMGALTAIAVAAEPARLAELVTTAETVRGANSWEARLARRIAARRPRG